MHRAVAMRLAPAVLVLMLAAPVFASLRTWESPAGTNARGQRSGNAKGASNARLTQQPPRSAALIEGSDETIEPYSKNQPGGQAAAALVRWSLLRVMGGNWFIGMLPGACETSTEDDLRSGVTCVRKNKQSPSQFVRARVIAVLFTRPTPYLASKARLAVGTGMYDLCTDARLLLIMVWVVLHRVVYETAFRDVLKMRVSRKTSYSCCPGWAQGGKANHGCTKAVCTQPCNNGGACLKPEFCGCRPGFTGKHCEQGDTSAPTTQVPHVSSREDREELEDDDERDFSVEYLMSKPHHPEEKDSFSLNEISSKLQNVIDSVTLLKNRVDRMERRLIDHHHHKRRSHLITEDPKVEALSRQMSVLERRMDKCACASESRNKINL
ncbi:hypothetical protein B566_EDAN002989 [Ephemera danica]|nr:hypothetical protein B566_EDAN002989 [Ephemera danica]